MEYDEQSRLLEDHQHAKNLTSLFEGPTSTETHEEVKVAHRLAAKSDGLSSSSSTTTPHHDTDTDFPCSSNKSPAILGAIPKDTKSTFVGSIVFLLYHVVFCLTQAAAIPRRHALESSTGVLARTAALGVFTAGPVFLLTLGDTIPAIYPASDLFLAPFLAQLATTIDEELFKDNLHNDHDVFFATFGLVVSTAFLLSGGLSILAARVKLANLGAFLPYPVLSGFFSAIGVLMWTLGISVDVGQTVGQIFTSGSRTVLSHAALHHAPSLLVGVLMHNLGPKNPLFVIGLVILTVFGSYVVLFVSRATLQSAQEQGWFFSPQDLVSPLKQDDFGPPLPFGIWASLARGNVHWEAYNTCIPTVFSLVFLYLLRCSLHSAALKKNGAYLTKKFAAAGKIGTGTSGGGTITSLGIESSASITSPSIGRSSGRGSVKRKEAPITLNTILENGYGYSQIVAALVGGITVAPSVAASETLYQLGAEKAPPQYGSCLLVLLFYCTNFSMVQYIPRPAFSSLMVLAGLDMCKTWLYSSYFNTKSKAEWLVGPLLVALTFVMGMLNAIFAGVALSTFLFAANFYRSGAVKFTGNGLNLSSTVERGMNETHWLEQHGDLIQILVVQNYLFFGNAQSVLTYINTMFEDDPSETEAESRNFLLPPKPKHLILDFTLVSGMDTSAVDIFKEIIDICHDNKCELYVAGCSPFLKSMLIYAGIKPPSPTLSRNGTRWFYLPDLESALAKAEDSLLTNTFHLEEKNNYETQRRQRQRSESIAEDGFLYALRKIEDQHELPAHELAAFRDKTTVVELQPGEVLDRNSEAHNGLYFIETGMMQIQRSDNTLTARFDSWRGPATTTLHSQSVESIGQLNARSGTIGRESALWKSNRRSEDYQSFRLARFGAGWVIGTIETLNGMKRPGVYVSTSACRLHFLPASAIEEAESSNPTLAMNLYKILASIHTKRQQVTIHHLNQHLKILDSPVPRLRGGGKIALAQIQHFQ